MACDRTWTQSFSNFKIPLLLGLLLTGQRVLGAAYPSECEFLFSFPVVHKLKINLEGLVAKEFGPNIEINEFNPSPDRRIARLGAYTLGAEPRVQYEVSGFLNLKTMKRIELVDAHYILQHPDLPEDQDRIGIIFNRNIVSFFKPGVSMRDFANSHRAQWSGEDYDRLFDTYILSRVWRRETFAGWGSRLNSILGEQVPRRFVSHSAQGSTCLVHDQNRRLVFAVDLEHKNVRWAISEARFQPERSPPYLLKFHYNDQGILATTVNALGKRIYLNLNRDSIFVPHMMGVAPKRDEDDESRDRWENNRHLLIEEVDDLSYFRLHEVNPQDGTQILLLETPHDNGVEELVARYIPKTDFVLVLLRSQREEAYQVELIDRKTMRVRSLLYVPKGFTRIDVSPTGRFFLAEFIFGDQGVVLVGDVQTGSFRWRIPVKGVPANSFFTDEGDVFVGNWDGDVAVWTLPEEQRFDMANSPANRD